LNSGGTAAVPLPSSITDGSAHKGPASGGGWTVL